MADDAKDTASTLPPEDAPGIVGYVLEKYNEAKQARYTHEQRWLKAFKNYRGIYDSSTQFRSTEKSKVFVKITKTKVLQDTEEKTPDQNLKLLLLKRVD